MSSLGVFMDLILLTKHFPFNNNDTPAESYLDTEILYLSKRYSRIIVFATEAVPSSRVYSFLPKNVIAFALGCSFSNSISKFDLLIKSLYKSDFRFFINEYKYKDRSDNNILKTLFKRYFICKATAKYVIIKNILQHFTDLNVSSIYSFWFFDTALLAFMLKSLFSRSVKVISRAHRYDLYAEENKIKYLPLRSFLLEKLDMVFPCSVQGMEYLVHKYSTFSNKVVPIYLGTSDLPDRSLCAHKVPFTILSCSRIVPVKQVDLLFDAVIFLIQKGYNINWVHFGDGPDMNCIKKKIQLFPNCSDRIFMKGFVSNKTLLHIYSTELFGCFINVSKSEGLPISIMEACGIGLPIIATDVGGTSEIVHNGDNGILLSKNPSVQDVADAIESLITLDNKDYFRMRSASRRIWEDNFQTSHNIDKLISFML